MQVPERGNIQNKKPERAQICVPFRLSGRAGTKLEPFIRRFGIVRQFIDIIIFINKLNDANIVLINASSQFQLKK